MPIENPFWMLKIRDKSKRAVKLCKTDPNKYNKYFRHTNTHLRHTNRLHQTDNQTPSHTNRQLRQTQGQVDRT